VSPSPSDLRLARAYVACGYLLGRRGDALSAGLVPAAPDLSLVAPLCDVDKQRRAKALAEVLTEVASTVLAERLL
jgi:hypothetical protein